MITDQEDWEAEHEDYLLSTQWKLRREKVLQRCRWVCEGCGSERATDVHHLTYRNWKSEFLFELVGLCRTCHDRVHQSETQRSWE